MGVGDRYGSRVKDSCGACELKPQEHVYSIKQKNPMCKGTRRWRMQGLVLTDDTGAASKISDRRIECTHA